MKRKAEMKVGPFLNPASLHESGCVSSGEGSGPDQLISTLDLHFFSGPVRSLGVTFDLRCPSGAPFSRLAQNDAQSGQGLAREVT